MTDNPPGTTPSMDRSYRGETDTDDATAATRRPIEVASSAARSGSIALLAGAYLSYRAARAAARGHLRALPYAAVAGVAVRTGLRQRRGGEESSEESGIDESIDVERPGESAADEGKKSTADDARAAIERQGTDRAGDPSGEDGNEDAEDPAGDAPDGDVSFVDADDPETEPRSHPTGVDRDPRRDADERVEVDISDSALADEPGEAVGPDPEQAQPTQTEGTEPEAEPDADPTVGRGREETGEATNVDEEAGTDGADDRDRDPESGAGGPLSDGGADEEDEDAEQLGQDETDMEPDASEEAEESDMSDG